MVMIVLAAFGYFAVMVVMARFSYEPEHDDQEHRVMIAAYSAIWPCTMLMSLFILLLQVTYIAESRWWARFANWLCAYRPDRRLPPTLVDTETPDP